MYIFLCLSAIDVINHKPLHDCYIMKDKDGRGGGEQFIGVSSMLGIKRKFPQLPIVSVTGAVYKPHLHRVSIVLNNSLMTGAVISITVPKAPLQTQYNNGDMTREKPLHRLPRTHHRLSMSGRTHNGNIWPVILLLFSNSRGDT